MHAFRALHGNSDPSPTLFLLTHSLKVPSGCERLYVDRIHSRLEPPKKNYRSVRTQRLHMIDSICDLTQIVF